MGLNRLKNCLDEHLRRPALVEAPSTGRDALRRVRQNGTRRSVSLDREEGRAWLSPSLPVSQSFFGSLRPGLQIYGTRPHGYAKRCWRACHLWLVRDTRHGEKPRDLQRRLQRFREQWLGL